MTFKFYFLTKFNDTNFSANLIYDNIFEIIQWGKNSLFNTQMVLGKLNSHMGNRCLFLMLHFPISHSYCNSCQAGLFPPLHCSLLSQGHQQFPSCQTNGQFWLYFTFALGYHWIPLFLKHYLHAASLTPHFHKFWPISLVSFATLFFSFPVM